MPCAANSVRRPLALPAALRLRDAEEQLGDALLQARRLDGRERRQRLHQGLGRAAGLGDHDEAHRREVVEGAECGGERLPVEVVVEARARAGALRRIGGAGNVPPPSWASAWPPRLEPPVPKKITARAPSHSLAKAASACGDIGRLLGDAQVRQPAAVVVVLQARDRRRQPVEPPVQFGLRQPVRRDRALEAAGDRLPVGRVAGIARGVRFGGIVNHAVRASVPIAKFVTLCRKRRTNFAIERTLAKL